MMAWALLLALSLCLGYAHSTAIASQELDKTPTTPEEQSALETLRTLGFTYNKEPEADRPAGTMLGYRGLADKPSDRPC
jgi:hypothetical protein